MNKKIGFIFLVIVPIIATLSILGMSYKCNKINESLINEVDSIEKESNISTIAGREEVIEKMREKVDKAKYVSNETNAYVMSLFAKLYSMNDDLNNSIEYFIQSINYALKTEDNYIVARNLINMSTIIINVEEFDIADEILNYVLTLEINNKDKYSIIEKYVYINLADAYARNNENDKSLSTIEKIKIDETLSSTEYNVIKIIRARALFQKGEINEADKILSALIIDKNNENVIIEEYMPYISLKCEVEFYKGNYDEVFDICDEFFDMCVDENHDQLKLVFLRKLVQNLNTELSDFSKETVLKYENELLNLYENVMKNKDNNNVNYIINTFEYESERYKELEQKYNRIVYTTGITITVFIFIIYLIFMIKKAKDDSNIDGLTQIYNRKCFNKYYEKYLKKYEDISLVVIDIDNFKQINDSFGHDFGDEVLKIIAKTLKERMLLLGNVYRYGGEEFCILFKNNNLDEVITISNEIRKNVEMLTWSKDIKVTISMGISHSLRDRDLFKVADENLYISKTNGKNKITY